MIDKIRLFQSMIKYHATIIGWLIKHDKVEKLNDRLVLFTKKAPASQYINTYSREVYLTNSDGSKRIPRSYGNNDFTKLNLIKGKVNELVEDGFEIFDIGNTCDRQCLTSQIGKILVTHYDILGDISIPEGLPRLKGEEACTYIKWMECKHEYLKEYDYGFNSYKVSSWGYIGTSGFSNQQPAVLKNIEKFGTFAYRPIYSQIEWTFDLVEKYKE